MAQAIRTPLHELHLAFGARMVEFAGWSMPVSFRGIQEEHTHTRSSCSVFDVSHMGRLTLTGLGAESLLQKVCTRNLSGAQTGRSYYSHICKQDGGVLDDVIVSRFPDRWGVVCNASNRERIVQWLSEHGRGVDVVISDETISTVMLAVQGPKAIALAEELTGLSFSSLQRYRFGVYETFGVTAVVYRSGYTGEDGLEVVVPAHVAAGLAPFLLGSPDQPRAEIRPAGLGARDTLRLEASMPLYGHELNEQTDSLTSGQAWCVDLTKDFIGAEAMRTLRDRGLSKKLVGLALEGRRIARQHSRIFYQGDVVGEVTSGTLSPTLGRSIAMGFVAASCAETGTHLEVEISGKLVSAETLPQPFYKRGAAS